MAGIFGELFLVSVSHETKHEKSLKNSGKIQSKIRGKIRDENSKKFGELSFCNFSDLTEMKKTRESGVQTTRSPNNGFRSTRSLDCWRMTIKSKHEMEISASCLRWGWSNLVDPTERPKTEVFLGKTGKQRVHQTLFSPDHEIRLYLNYRDWPRSDEF